MNIQEATKMALVQDKCIKMQDGAFPYILKPTDGALYCVGIFPETKETFPMWNPSANDLLSDKWELAEYPLGIPPIEQMFTEVINATEKSSEQEKEELINACKVLEGSAMGTLRKQILLLSERSHSEVTALELAELTKVMALAIDCAFKD